MSGYTGSLGLAVITIDNALLWVDGRYEAQADEQLDCQWTVLHTSSSDTPTASQWLATVLPPGSRVGADPRRVPNYIWMDWKRTLGERFVSFLSTFHIKSQNHEHREGMQESALASSWVMK